MRAHWYATCLGLSLLAGVLLPSHAQTPAAPAAPATQDTAPAGGVGASAGTGPGAGAAAPISERVRQEAARPYYWIRLQATQPGRNPVRSRPGSAGISGTAGNPGAGAAPATAPAPATTAATVAATAPGATPASTPPAGRSLAAVEGPAPAVLTADTVEALIERAPPGTGLFPAATAPLPPALATSSANAPPTAAGGDVRPGLATDDASLPWPEPTPAEAGRTPLILLHQVEPNFPAAWMQRLRQGSVEVQFVVEPDGSVSRVTALRSTQRGLEAAAREAVLAWRFAPIAQATTASATLAFDVER